MDVLLDDPELMVKDTAQRLAAHLAPAGVAELEAFDSSRAWKALEEPGFVGFRLPEVSGGGDASTVMAAMVVEALAAHLVPVPYLGSAMAIELLLAAGAAPETLERVASGNARVSIGFSPDLSEVSGSGDAAVAVDGAGSSAVIAFGDGGRLIALTPGGSATGADLTRVIVRADRSQQTDIGPLGVLEEEPGKRFLARSLALVAADLVGLMSAALDTAVAHASTREQFGVPIGTFQAVQHLAAEQLVSLEGARSLTEYAAWASDESSADDALLAAYTAKAYAARAGRAVCEAVIQIHGGMGITWDCMAHVYLKRALTDACLFGDFSSNLSNIAALRAGRWSWREMT